MEFHESKTLTLPIAKHESLTVNVFLILVLIWLSFVVIEVGETGLPVTISYQFRFILVWFILLAQSILRKSLPFMESRVLLMLFTIALAGLKTYV